MLQSEFDRLTSRPYTEAEFSEIHYVYCYHPAVQSKKDIADLWTIGGICLIKGHVAHRTAGRNGKMQIGCSQNGIRARQRCV